MKQFLIVNVPNTWYLFKNISWKSKNSTSMDASSQKNCQKQNLRNWKEIEDYRKNKHSIKKMPFELMDIIEYNNALRE